MIGAVDSEPLPEAFDPPPPPEPDKWTALVPVPAGVPDPTHRHGRLGEPSAVWTYRDEDGNRLGYVCRFETPNGPRPKDIRPQTYCESSDGRRAWRWQTWDEPRPLYGLDRLARNPNAPAVLVEGEKTADAASRLIPDAVVITSPGGAKAAGKADWSPVQGRCLIIWPDADEAGAQYALRVAQLAHNAGAAEVRVVTLPDGLPEGWDLSDPLPDGLTLETVLDRISTAPTSEVARPNSNGIRPSFRLRNDCVEYTEESNGDGAKEWTPVCSRLEVLACTRSADGEDWGRLLAVTDSDGNTHEWAMPMAALAGDGTAYRERLLSLGLHIEPGQKTRNRLQSYISTTQPTARARCVSRVGWHNTRDGAVYILPDGAYGPTTERVLFQSMTTAEHAYRTAGTLAEWQRHIALPAAGNSRLVFTLSCAFAAPLLQLADEESGGFHLRGPSSVGKTTAVKAAASVWGGGSVGGYVRTWRATANGLEGLAEMHCDALLCLDEMSQVNPREAGETAYMLANGAGKSRAGRNGKARQSAQWRVLVLSNGEVSLADKMNEAGQRTRAGQEARLVDVQADAGAGLGLFEDLHGVSSPEAFARSISDAAKRFYGTAARDYLTRLTANSDGLGDAVRTARKRWVSKHCPADADGQVLRVAGRFGLVAAAGELAATMGILPWGEGEAEKAAASCFEAWLEVRGGTGAAEITAGIEQVRHFIAVHGEARFSSDSDDRPTINRAGFRVRGAEGTTDFLVLPQVWRREICAGFDPRAIANALIERGVLIPDAKDGKPQSRHRLPSLGVKRVYYLTAEILGDGGNDPTEETPWDGIDHA